MTHQDNNAGPARRARSADTRLASWLLLWPFTTLYFTILPAVFSILEATETDRSFTQAAEFVAAWLLATHTEQGSGTISGFGFLAVVATIVIGMAFSLPPEGVQSLPEKNRNMIGILILSITLLLSLFSAAVLWVIIWKQATFESALLLLSAWLISLVAGLVELKRPAEQRLSAAKQYRDKIREGARKYGLQTEDRIRTSQLMRTEFTYWLVAIIALPLLGTLGLLCDLGGLPNHHQWAGPFCLLGIGSLVASAGWRMTTSLPPHSLSDRIISWAGRGLGIILVILISWIAYASGLRWLSFTSALAALMAVLLYICPATEKRFPFMKILREDATRKRIQRADELCNDLSQEIHQAGPRTGDVAIMDADGWI